MGLSSWPVASAFLSVRAAFSSAAFEIDGEMFEIETGNFGTTVHIDQNFESNQSQPIFLYWSPYSADVNDNYYHIKIHSERQSIPPPASLMFVTNTASDNISIIDRFKLRVVDVIKSGAAPRGMVYSSLFQQLFIANSGDNSISIIDLASRQNIRTIYLDFGDEPSRLALSHDEMNLYVLNYSSNSLIVYELPSFQETDRQSVGFEPLGIAVGRYSTYISHLSTDYLTQYNPSNLTISNSYEIPGTASEILVDINNNRLYAADDDQRSIIIFNTESGNLDETIRLCGKVTGIVLDNHSGYLFAAQSGCNEISIIQTDNAFLIGQMSLPESPGLITLEPERREIFTVLPHSNQIAAVNLINQSISSIIDVGENPFMILVPK